MIISISAAKTKASKFVVGATVQHIQAKKVAGGRSQPTPSVRRGRITDIQNTAAGELKSITIKFRDGEVKYTAAKFNKLIEAPLPTNSKPAGESLRIVSKETAKKSASTSFDKEIAQLRKERQDLDAKLAALVKKADEEKAKIAKEKFETSKTTADIARGSFRTDMDGKSFKSTTLRKAMSKRPKTNDGKSSIFFISDAGKETRVMRFTNKTHSGQIARSPSWNFVSMSVFNKFQPLLKYSK